MGGGGRGGGKGFTEEIAGEFVFGCHDGFVSGRGRENERRKRKGE